jgi:hypothetical protein
MHSVQYSLLEWEELKTAVLNEYVFPKIPPTIGRYSPEQCVEEFIGLSHVPRHEN